MHPGPDDPEQNGADPEQCLHERKKNDSLVSVADLDLITHQNFQNF
jgi:hypothetical protein